MKVFSSTGESSEIPLRTGSEAAPSVYEFGDFRLDVIKRRLTGRDGVPLPLTARVFDTLLFLVQHSGTVLDKERLMEAVWPDSIVEENNLSQNISTLRRLLGDAPGAPRYIVTVPGRGYKFAPEVTISYLNAMPQEAVTAEPATPNVESERKQPAHAAPYLVAAAVLVAAAAIAFVVIYARSRPHTAGALPEKSIAVLPFDNLSSDADNAYFTAGVQDEILSDLAKIADLKVISRTSANLYKSGSPRNAREIGQQLGVAHLLEGSVQRTGNHLRVNAQLVDTRTDAHVWAQSYDRELADVFAIQSEIAQTIAGQLQARISPNEKARIETRPTANPEAYLLYLQAKERLRTGASKQDALAADELFAQSIARDPSFALAYAGASILNSRVFALGREPERKAKARQLLDQALRLAPELGDAHVALGLYLYRVEGDYASALNEFAIAQAASPNNPEILELTGLIYRRMGRWREALAAFEPAQELDPRHVHIAGPDTLLLLRRWSDAAKALELASKLEPELADPWFDLANLEVYQHEDPAAGRAILDSLPVPMQATPDVAETRWELALTARDFAAAEQLAPDLPAEEFPVHQPKNFYLGMVALARGDSASARTLFDDILPFYETAARDHPNDPSFHDLLGRVYAALGRKEEAVGESKRAVELCPTSKDAVEGARYLSDLAKVYALTGDAERALPLSERLLTTPAAIGITRAELRLRWEWDGLRADPRFVKLIAGPEPQTVYK